MSSNPSPLSARSRQQAGRTSNLTASEQRFYTAVPRFEDYVRRACSKSVILLRSDIAESIVHGIKDLEREYSNACEEAVAANRLVADHEARLGATIVLVHLQILAKINELSEFAESGTPV